MTIVRCGALVLMTVLVAITASAQDAATMQDILTKLRAGGHVIVVRHGATHADQADTDPLNLDNVAKQRQLNDKGRADATAVGEAFRGAAIPVGKSYSSRFYRAVETARLIGGKEPQTTPDITEGGQVVERAEEGVEHRRLRLVAPEHDPDLAEERWRELHRAEPPRPDLSLGGEPRRHRQPQPRLDELLDRLRVTELHRQRRHGAAPLKPLVDDATKRRP